jgi:hypothetical protein
LEGLDVDGKIILRLDAREMVWEVVDWMRLAQDRDQWRDLVSTVMNLHVP